MTLVCHWGPRSLDTMRTFPATLVVLPYDQQVATRPGEIQAYARELPLATFNIRATPTSLSMRALELLH